MKGASHFLNRSHISSVAISQIAQTFIDGISAQTEKHATM